MNIEEMTPRQLVHMARLEGRKGPADAEMTSPAWDRPSDARKAAIHAERRRLDWMRPHDRWEEEESEARMNRAVRTGQGI